MAVTTTKTNKPLNPRGNDQSPKGYNRAELYTGKALDFDGVNDKITSSVNTTIFSDSGTISGYLKLDGLGGIKAGFGFRLSAQSEFYLLFVNNNSEYRMRTTNGHTDVITDLSEFVGRWTLFTCTFGAGVMKLYADGNLLASSNYTGTFVTNSSATYSFGESGGGSFWYDGQASNARVFNTALTAAQVADLYNNPEKIVPTGVADSALKLWLPMQEGAGTTAYDGSGNGNHGTISGATWTHGVGSPVAQTAVIDWNKKENIVRLSEEINVLSGFAGWNQSSGNPIESTNETAPDGRNTASLVNVEAESSAEFLYLFQAPVISGETYTISIWTKLGTANNAVFVLNNSSAWNTMSEDFVATAANGYDEWKQVSMTFTAPSTNKINLHIGYHEENGVTQQDLGTFYIWGAALHKGSTPVLVPTFGTAQSSEVLLPQGLTSGRDITGVNLFDNVRKQGALNLDGNSWAEVHDNGSFDFGTAVSLEAWVYWQGDNNDDGILGRYGTTSAERDCTIYAYSGGIQFYVTSNAVSYTSMTNGWRHIVGTYDGANKRLYVDGTQVNSSAETSTMPGGSIPMEIGRYKESSATTFTQPIAQPRIYNRALTAEEVERNYNAGKNIYK